MNKKDIDVIQGANHFGLYVIQEANYLGTVETPIKIVASYNLANKIKKHLENKYHYHSFNIFKVPFIKK